MDKNDGLHTMQQNLQPRSNELPLPIACLL